MEIEENLVAVHAYLCADGYVIKGEKRKYYRVGFRNTNLTLLKDFKIRFEKIFKDKIKLREGERCEKCSKKIYLKLTEKFGSFYSKEWKTIKLSKRLSQIWLRAFFDCEGWVYNKTHQNRHIGLDIINEEGLDEIIKMLNLLGIRTIKKVVKRGKMFRLFIYGRENLIEFREKIGFLHPDKKKKLNEAIADYVNYFWNFPKEEKECRTFIRNILKQKARIKKPYYVRIICKEKINLDTLQKFLKKFYGVNCIVYKSVNGLGTTYHELDICRRGEVKKLVKNKRIPNVFK
jgi:hypothetical protein